MWHIALLSHASHEPRRYNRISPNAKLVELSQAVLKGHYHEKEGIMQQTWNIVMKQRLLEQVLENCEIREIHLSHRELEGGNDAQSMTFDIASKALLPLILAPITTSDSAFWPLSCWLLLVCS